MPAWMTQMEKNSDIVIMHAYAPLLVNVSPGARQWRPNLIGYDALRVYGSPSNHAIAMFSTHLGDEILKTTVVDSSVLVSATRDSRSRMVHVKLVNPADTAVPVQIEATRAALASGGTVLTLAGPRQATNSIDDPVRVVPVTTKIPGVTSPFTVPANGIVVLTLRQQ
jgi:alpha-N-arabinofuranosidase